jgi:hypothetical protein
MAERRAAFSSSGVLGRFPDAVARPTGFDVREEDSDAPDRRGDVRTGVATFGE